MKTVMILFALCALFVLRPTAAHAQMSSTVATPREPAPTAEATSPDTTPSGAAPHDASTAAEPREHSTGLLVAGGITFGLPYVVSAIGGLAVLASDGAWEGGVMLLPVAGPFVAGVGAFGNGSAGLGVAMLLDFGLQATGATLLAVDLLRTRHAGRSARSARRSGVSAWNITPTWMPGGAGLALTVSHF